MEANNEFLWDRKDLLKKAFKELRYPAHETGFAKLKSNNPPPSHIVKSFKGLLRSINQGCVDTYNPVEFPAQQVNQAKVGREIQDLATELARLKVDNARWGTWLLISQLFCGAILATIGAIPVLMNVTDKNTGNSHNEQKIEINRTNDDTDEATSHYRSTSPAIEGHE